MAELTFETLRFTRDKSRLKVIFQNLFWFHIPETELAKIGPFEARGGTISFEDVSEAKARHKFQRLLDQGFLNLRSSLGRKAVYIHRASGIPLIGNQAFGIVDRNSNIVEVKPMTGCNLKCIFCSVDEGRGTPNDTDYVVDARYLTEELGSLLEVKNCEVDVFVNTHGEPLLYADMVELISGISSLRKIRTLAIITNGTMLTTKLIDRLIEAGLTQLNVSINAFSHDMACRLAGTTYNVEHVKEMVKYAKSRGLRVIIAPVLLHGMNDDEIEALVDFAGEAGVDDVGIQNFLAYKKGRNPVDQLPWDDFYSWLGGLEKRKKVTLMRFGKSSVRPSAKLELPAKRGMVVDVRIVAPGRHDGEMLGVFDNRNITVIGAERSGNVKVRILRSKHNIFFGKVV